jgi:bifunctional DNA-binding transcriptional regulator/antitoxin component of YhaV-PrlF toxin-antitoxin module
MKVVERVSMSTWMTLKLSSAGRLTIPQRLLARLGVREGDEVLLQEVSEGVILLSAAKLSRPQIADYLLRSLVKGVGPLAEKLQIRDEDEAIK